MPATTKLEVATELLTEGLRLYLEGKAYFASINLAGAAEEILGGYVRENGGVPAFDSTRDAAVRFSKFFRADDGKSNLGDMANVINDAKNSTKHKRGKTDNYVDFDPKAEAYDVLDRAVDNYYKLQSRFNLREIDDLRNFNNARSSGLCG